jgi:TetR/AcrR family transcriptional regulator of autoinduction and epiphytic fitness
LHTQCKSRTVRAVTTTVDGRSARSARTRDAVVDALLALLDDGDLRPTASRVAARAGVSLRSVYVRFEDLDALYAEAAQRQWERLSTLGEDPPSDAPRAERISSFLTQRCRVLETAAPVRRAAELQEPFNAALGASLTWARNLSRDQVARTFQPELAQRRGAARSRLLDALDVATGSTTWEVLRRHRNLSPVAARRVVSDMVTALTAPTTDHSHHSTDEP